MFEGKMQNVYIVEPLLNMYSPNGGLMVDGRCGCVDDIAIAF